MVFLIIFIFVSGFIAYFGDLLGRRMGKKRLTLFNLRPRHTAIIITTITGMLISALALVLFTSINHEFKRVLTEYKQIIAQNEHYSSANIVLERRNTALINRSKTLEKEVWLRQTEVKKARSLAENAEKAKNKALSTVTRLEDAISNKQKQLAALKSRTQSAESLVKQRTSELRNLQAKMNVAQKDLAKAQANLTNAETKLAGAQAKLSTTLQQLADADKKLKELNQANIEQQQQLKDSQALLVKMGKEKYEVERQASDLRNRDLIVRQGDEIARMVISPRQSAFGIRGDLFSLLNLASDKAEEMGAKSGTNDRTVRLIFRQIVDREHGLSIENESYCVKMATDAIGNGFSDALVRVVCAENTLAGEQVPVELKLYINNRVYRKGARIAGMRIDGRLSEGRILLSLIDFLQNQVSNSAIRAGIIPISNPNPRTALGQDPQKQVDALMSVVDRIKSQNTKVDVIVYASDDVYAAGPLNMDNMQFVIQPVD